MSSERREGVQLGAVAEKDELKSVACDVACDA